MNIRARTEEIEAAVLAPWATRASESAGRVCREPSDDLRTAFQRDRDRIVHSKAFRRLMHKTQVFLAPEGDHYRTRLTHTLEVSQVARTICRALRLNEDLVEAICLAHDVGHTPFGHIGEEVLSKAMGRPFEHNRQSLRVVDHLERDGRGLNLTSEVRDGILNHTWRTAEPSTAEARVARWADRIAYVNHDVDDAVRAGVLDPADLPGDVIETLGRSCSERVNTMVVALVQRSSAEHDVCMRADVAEAMQALRAFLFERVYLSAGRREEEKAAGVLEALYSAFRRDDSLLPPSRAPGSDDDRVADHISGMTDRYALRTFQRLFVPRTSP